ncbi:hypothetical protein MMC11_003547 [Xylographa trunciseda]|nr:hypothetical protein [Xylographa trunciseda]
MKSIASKLRYRPVRQSTGKTLETSAGVPDLGALSLDNSQGTSRGLAEFSQELDESFELGGDLSVRLAGAAEKYHNSRLGNGGKLWTCAPSEADLILIAAGCARAVYNSNTEPYERGYIISRLSHVSPSLNGVVKATTFHTIGRDSLIIATDRLLPALVISIRGTSRIIDWLINLNSGLQDANLALDDEALSTPLPLMRDFSTHAGFANAAAALESAVTTQIRSVLKAGKIEHVLFTGHSAGGAVASLLFLRFLSVAARDYPSMRFSCITFGSPPVVTPDISDIFKYIRKDDQHDRLGLTLAFVNEGDLVSRLDKDYVLSIKRLLDVGGPEIEKKECNDSRSDEIPVWYLPQAALSMIGDIVMLRKERLKEQKPVYSSMLVSPKEFSSLLFCNKDAHHLEVYLGNIKKLKERSIENI